MSEPEPIVKVENGQEQEIPVTRTHWRNRPLTAATLFAVVTPLIAAAAVGGIGLYIKSEVAAAVVAEHQIAQDRRFDDFKADIRLQIEQNRKSNSEEMKDLKADVKLVLIQQAEGKGAMDRLSWMLTHVRDKELK